MIIIKKIKPKIPKTVPNIDFNNPELARSFTFSLLECFPKIPNTIPGTPGKNAYTPMNGIQNIHKETIPKIFDTFENADQQPASSLGASFALG